MLRALLAGPAAALLLISVASAQQVVPPEVQQVLLCGHVFGLKGEADRAAGDEGSATELGSRSEELIARGRLQLQEAGFDAKSVEAAVNGTALIGGIRYASEGAAIFSECMALAG